jgi:hypothetical protein
MMSPHAKDNLGILQNFHAEAAFGLEQAELEDQMSKPSTRLTPPPSSEQSERKSQKALEKKEEAKLIVEAWHREERSGRLAEGRGKLW